MEESPFQTRDESDRSAEMLGCCSIEASSSTYRKFWAHDPGLFEPRTYRTGWIHGVEKLPARRDCNSRYVLREDGTPLRCELRRVGRVNGLPEAELIGDVMNLAFQDGAFDRLREFGALHHISRPAEGVAEMLRVWKIGVFISDCNYLGRDPGCPFLLKQLFNSAGLWPTPDFIRTKGKAIRSLKEMVWPIRIRIRWLQANYTGMWFSAFSKYDEQRPNLYRASPVWRFPDWKIAPAMTAEHVRRPGSPGGSLLPATVSKRSIVPHACRRGIIPGKSSEDSRSTAGMERYARACHGQRVG